MFAEHSGKTAIDQCLEKVLEILILILQVTNAADDTYSIFFLQNLFVCLFDLILYVPSTIFQLCRD